MALHDILQANAEDMGITGQDMQQGAQGSRPPPPLWNEMLGDGDPPQLQPLTEMDGALIERQRRLVKRMGETPYYLLDEKKVKAKYRRTRSTSPA